MAAATTPQPFWTSKTFIALTLDLIYNLLKASGRLPSWITTEEATLIINSLLAAAGMYFRWGADQPLTTNPAAVVLPPAGSGDH